MTQEQAKRTVRDALRKGTAVRAGLGTLFGFGLAMFPLAILVRFAMFAPTMGRPVRDDEIVIMIVLLGLLLAALVILVQSIRLFRVDSSKVGQALMHSPEDVDRVAYAVTDISVNGIRVRRVHAVTISTVMGHSLRVEVPAPEVETLLAALKSILGPNTVFHP